MSKRRLHRSQPKQELFSGLPDPVETKESHWTQCLSGASFWQPSRLALSAWLDHAPLAFWLIDVIRPRQLVELGTHRGLSYCAFCQAVERLEVGTRCYAVDSWRGDEHSGFYGEDVIEELRNYHDPRYSGFSQLLRMDFDDAVTNFENGSIDLLHIDGRHFYEDVRHDFETWRSKLSDRAIVVFHDTNVRDRGFGVFRLWKELSEQHPSFEFVHGYGLGILGFGTALPRGLKPLFDLSAEPSGRDKLRAAYTQLGTRLQTIYHLETAESGMRGQIRHLETVLTELTATVADRDHLVSQRDAEIQQKTADIRQRDTEILRRDDQIHHLRTHLTESTVALTDRTHALSLRNLEIQQTLASIQERDTEIARRDAQTRQFEAQLADSIAALTNRDHALSQRHAEIQQKTADIYQRETELLRRDDRIHQLETQLTESIAALTDRDHTLSQREAELHQRLMDIQERDTAIRQRDARISQLELQLVENKTTAIGALDELKNEQATAAQLRQHLAERQQLHDRICRAFDEAHRELSHTTEIIQNMRNSTCWRITAPLRSKFVQALYRPLRRSPHADETTRSLTSEETEQSLRNELVASQPAHPAPSTASASAPAGRALIDFRCTSDAHFIFIGRSPYTGPSLPGRTLCRSGCSSRCGGKNCDSCRSLP